MTVIDMVEVRRAAAILRRRWPSLEQHDAESCAGEAAVQVGTDDQGRLVAVAKLRAIDHYRHHLSTSRRNGQPVDRITVAVNGDVLAVDGFEDRVLAVDEVMRLLACLSPRERFVALAVSVGWSGVEIAAVLGVCPSRVSQIRARVRRAGVEAA